MSTPSGPQWSPQNPDNQVPPAIQPYAMPPATQQPPVYGAQPGYPGYYAPPQRTNGMAIASMVLGILWIYWIGSILALIFGYVARNQIRQRQESGDGMAIAGIVLGWVGVGSFAIGLVIVLIAGVPFLFL